MASKSKATQVHDEDSDLDDLLDDVLDDFNDLSTKEKDTPPPKAESTDAAELDDVLDSDEFARQLAAGMEELMGQDPEMKNVFEQVWSSLETPGTPEPTKIPPTAGAAAGSSSSFQDKIAQTMDKLKESSKEVDTSIADTSEDAFMTELMRQMESLTENGEFEHVLEGMMQQLMSKDMLYEPMKDLSKKYPGWLDANRATLTKSELEMYEKQYEFCKSIVAKYDDPKFDEKDESQTKEIMDLMQKMQDLGQPPAALLEEMAPGMNLGQPGEIPDMKDMENCTIM
ncbi:Peroxisome chaperone and import receptor [Apophysomyces sp. BC1034]|nr:Peroxisome chaperone and import receptor [Apophysomyces sp. BC1015]KAG0179958.1 Peroxisome chaperone and import receptor [Apophysomyces sp. BC1021]KAG0189327.1 Peroxisome chaperone and import receptor [Apophysomyces sp. BC1034]